MSNETISIRKARPEDWQTLQRLNYEVYEASQPFDPWLIMDHPFTEASIAYYQKICTDYDGCVLIAEDGGDPVGYLVGVESNVDYRKARFGEIDHMGVTLNKRSLGIGSLLVNEFRLWCREKGIDYMSVRTYFKSEKMRKFYEKQGMFPNDIAYFGKVL
jgi:GNAT superfamily N-acetyltransferase